MAAIIALAGLKALLSASIFVMNSHFVTFGYIRSVFALSVYAGADIMGFTTYALRVIDARGSAMEFLWLR